jgi:drug/metabolite transporter (DMT)-like permease
MRNASAVMTGYHARHTMPPRHRTELLALAALFAGALCTGGAGVLVRLSETGPTATAFWRGLLALPALWIWALLEARNRAPAGPMPGTLSSLRHRGYFWGGAAFAGDLALWNYSLIHSSVAAATLEANLAPLIVTLIAWLAWHERPRPAFLAAIAMALVGLALIVAPKLQHASGEILGDACGVGTALFYATYILVVARLRARHGTGAVMFHTTAVFTILLLPLALTQKLLPDTAQGWGVLVACALAAQFLGQGLIAYALAHLPATFSSVALYVQSIGAAVCAWIVLGEHLAPVQLVGGCIVLCGIALASSARKHAPALAPARSSAAEPT